jgi:hypothetical protein
MIGKYGSLTVAARQIANDPTTQAHPGQDIPCTKSLQMVMCCLAARDGRGLEDKWEISG